MTDKLEHDYVLGHSEGEIRRLEWQGQLLAPGTERILRAAGLTQGMSVLDIGTGAGDVAMLAAEIVGPSGSVLGIDQEASVLARARTRAENSGLRHIHYEAATLDSLSAVTAFDAVVGRFVLCLQPDRASFLRQAAAHLRPGGMLLFIEPGGVELNAPHERREVCWSNPPVALYEDMVRHIFVAFTRGGAREETGNNLVSLFHEAGLPEPTMLEETLLGGAASPIIDWLCLTLETLLPSLERHGTASAKTIEIGTLPARLRAAISESHSQVRFTSLTGGWARVK